MFLQNGGRGDCRWRGKSENNATCTEVVPGKHDITHKGVKCYAKKTCGQYADQYPLHTGTNLEQVVITLSQGRQVIKYTWLLLDKCSSNFVSNNPKMMKNIK